MKDIQRIHHITAIVGDPQENVDFYQDILGLRLIKQTVNFDDTNTYHLYFGKPNEEPTWAITFFNWPNDAKGEVGGGQIGRIAFRIPKGSMEEWAEHLNSHAIETEVTQLFNQDTLEFIDVHGLALALVEGENKAETKAIEDLHGTVYLSLKYEESADAIENTLNLERVAEDEQAIHFETHGEERHRILVWKENLPLKRLGVGTVHHVAYRVEDDEDLFSWQDHLREAGYKATDMRDRNYFHAVYHKEPGRITIELATQGPGFTVDESIEELGHKIQLPEFYEDQREELIKNLKKIQP